MTESTSSNSERVTPRTMAEALAGKRGLDYFPDDRCTVCGAMVWYDGLRYQQTHDPAKHGVGAESGEGVDARRRSQPENLTAITHRLEQNVRAQAVRRSYGDDED